MKECNILGVNINVTDMEETVEYIEEKMNELKGGYICVSNVHTTVMSYENEKYKNIQNLAALRLPDGRPLSIVSKIRSFKDAQRVTGPDLMNEIFKISEEKGYSHYFYGSTEITLNKMKDNLYEKYQNIFISGMYSPPFRDLNKDEEEEIIRNINMVNPDFIWVGLGAPKQEIWMNKNQGKVNGIMIGVGAGFDYFAGNIKRAPKWMQEFGLEWLYRLMQDPKRLLKRYITTNTKFIYYMIIQPLKAKLTIKG